MHLNTMSELWNYLWTDAETQFLARQKSFTVSLYKQFSPLCNPQCYAFRDFNKTLKAAALSVEQLAVLSISKLI